MLTRLFAESIRARGAVSKGGPSGKVLYFADVAALRPWKDYSVYCASKAGLAAAAKAFAKELAPEVTVNAIAPGIVEGTELEAGERERQLGRIPMGRFGRAEEVVQTVLFLLKNDYVTGEILVLDGGRSL